MANQSDLLKLADPLQLAARIEELRRDECESWHVVKEPHKYPDGTLHFNHVEYEHDGVTVQIAGHVTAEIAELLCLFQNNGDLIVKALRALAGMEKQP